MLVPTIGTPTCYQPSALSRANGFTLMEVLVAILILAMGASGVITMQMHAMRMSQESGFLLSASQLAAELAERMHTQQIDDYLFTFDSAANSTKVSGSAGDCYRNACDSSMLASFTISDWQTTLEQRLPQARATICRDQASTSIDTPPRWDCDQHPGSALVIKIGWTARSHSRDVPGLVFVTGK